MSFIVVADDLTGALDAGAPFVQAERSVPVYWRGEIRPAPSACSTESRSLEPGEASARLLSSLGKLPEGAVPFKKVDSLLRGNSLADITTCQRWGRFRSIVFAPAFPRQDRTIHCGYLRYPQGKVDIASGLCALGAEFRAVQPDESTFGEGMVLCDAETDDDMAAIARLGSEMPGPRLWCGSAGLAIALAPARMASARDFPRPDTVVIGSRTPLSRADLERMRRSPGVVTEIVTGASTFFGPRRLSESERLTLGFDMPLMPNDKARQIISGAIGTLVACRRPRGGVIVVGGDTLRMLLDAIAAERLDLFGTWAPGVPVSRIIGGPWNGTTVFSKSGSFVDEGLFEYFLNEDETNDR